MTFQTLAPLASELSVFSASQILAPISISISLALPRPTLPPSPPLINSISSLCVSLGSSALHPQLTARSHVSSFSPAPLRGCGTGREAWSGDSEWGVRPELAAFPGEKRKQDPPNPLPSSYPTPTPPPRGCRDSTVSGLEGLGAPR